MLCVRGGDVPVLLRHEHLRELFRGKLLLLHRPSRDLGALRDGDLLLCRSDELRELRRGQFPGRDRVLPVLVVHGGQLLSQCGPKRGH